LSATTEIDCGKDLAVTFTVHSSRGEEVMTTFRLSAAAAVAKGRTLMADGWQVFITDPGGIRHQPSEFDRLASPRQATD
jgi:hypothetical protein